MEVMFVAPDEDSDDENNEYEDEHGFRFVHETHFCFWSVENKMEQLEQMRS